MQKPRPYMPSIETKHPTTTGYFLPSNFVKDAFQKDVIFGKKKHQILPQLLEI